MTQSAALLIEQANGLARLTLNRPTAGNSIDLALARELMEASIQCDEDDSIRCVSLSGTGRLFCAGGDIQSFIAAGERAPALLKELTGYLHMAIARFARMNKPLVTVVNGPAAGAGVGLAALGDIVLAARSAHFTLAYSNIALSPDAGCTWLLPRLIGRRKAQELMLTNRRVSAEEAERIGLITRAVDDDTLSQVATEQLQQVAEAATLALGHTRRLLLSSLDASLETHLECEARSIAELGRTRDFREGIDAFRGRRKPNFTGRDGV
jgi:2-(1,2-epoxy-1,2-dihydrophenyl)acetyl-CoA isomerase